MKKNAREITKMVVGLLVQYGTASVVHGFINNNTNPERIDQKIGVAAASVAIGGLVAHKTVQHSDKMVDDFFDILDKIKNV